MKPKLLIVEDDEMVARMLKRILSRTWKIDCIIHSADFAAKKLYLGELLPNAVITDWDCPGNGDGENVIKAAFSRRIPIVLHTGNLRIKNVGCEIVYKPADVKEIIAALNRAYIQ